MRLLLKNHMRNALDSLKINRSRSLLTVVGIAIGVASILIVLSLGGGVQQLVSDQVVNVGGNIMVVRPRTNWGAENENMISNSLSFTQNYARSSLSQEDIKSIMEVEQVTSTAPLAVLKHNIKADNTVEAATIAASTESLDDIINLPLKDGSFLSENTDSKVVVLGYGMAMRLFDSTEVLNRSVYIKGESYMVVGVLAELKDPINFNDVDFDNMALISMAQAEIIDKNFQIQQINTKVANAEALSTAAEQIFSKLLENHKGEPDFTVSYGADITHPSEDLFKMLTVMLSVVAGVSLVVGGIGVMNIMLVSVSERTREIGIRKAVGATNGQILAQFLFEALILAILGGFLGFLFGYAFAFGVSLFTPFAPVVTAEIVLTAVAVCVAVGVVFGVYPAFKAAWKNPIDALRYYR